MKTHSPMQRLDDEAIGGQIVGGDSHRVRVFPGGRVCAHDGCSTRLSVYNRGDVCALHDRLGGALASPRRVTCPAQHRAA